MTARKLLRYDPSPYGGMDPMGHGRWVEYHEAKALIDRANRSRRRFLAAWALRRHNVWHSRASSVYDLRDPRMCLRRARKLYALAMRLRGSP